MIQLRGDARLMPNGWSGAGSGKVSDRDMEKKHHYNFWYFVLALMAILYLQQLWQENQRIELVPFSTFEQFIEEGIISEVYVGEDYVRGVFLNPTPDGKTEFYTTRVDPDLAERLIANGIVVTGEVESGWLANIISWILPLLIFLAVWFFVFRNFAERQGMGGGLMTVGKSKAKVYMEREIDVTFDDVAGVDEAKAEVQEVVNFLKNPETYGRLGAHIPKGILLVGPPGTGKTLLARAIAGEANVPFLSINGSEFVEMFVGVGAARVRDLFQDARKVAPCIIFIDELDALGRARGVFPGGGGHDEKEQTLNQLLAELDGFDTQTSRVVLLAATNRPEILDPALLRAGRFDRQVLVDKPERRGREAILNIHLRKILLGDDVDSAAIAALTPGFTGADLANLVNEAALLATRVGKEQVTMDDFTQAIERIVAGLEKKNRILNEMERRTVAFHEMGHALVALATPGVDPVHKISILQRGVAALGYTLQQPLEDRYLMKTQELKDKIMVLLGGRAAESVMMDDLSTGAADDLVKATDLARSMVARFGLEPKVGQAVYDYQNTPFLGAEGQQFLRRRDYSEETARKIDAAVEGLINDAFEAARAVLIENRSLLEEGAAVLLEWETLEGPALAEYASRVQKRTRGNVAAVVL